VFFYDTITSKVVSFFSVARERHAQIKEYLLTTYRNLRITIEGNWMRLDFDDDGWVSVEDLK